jgi:pantothenate kinase
MAKLSALIDYVRSCAAGDDRTILGIVGAPGAGKSSLAATLVDAVGGRARLVPMDGFHLAQSELERLGLSAVKGAPTTFDVGGYVSLLCRIRRREEPVVYAPTFDRRLEQAIAGAIAIPADVPVVVTEGNYLLLRDGAWRSVRGLLDESWYVDVPEEDRLGRLVARHIEYGSSRESATAKALGPDQDNAEIIRSSRNYASRIILVQKAEDDWQYA